MQKYKIKSLYDNITDGGSKFKLSAVLGISVDEADTIITEYFNQVPKVKSVLESCSKYALKNSYIRSLKPYSIVRHFEYSKEDLKQVGAVERAGKNTVIQSSGAMMCKLALVNIRKKIKTLDYKVIMFLQIHDAIFCYVQEDKAEEWAEIQKEIMEEAGREFIKSIPVKSDVIISDYWSK